MKSKNLQQLIELQGMARVLHNVLLQYPSVQLIAYLKEHEVALTWPDLTRSPLNEKGKAQIHRFLEACDLENLDTLKLDYGQLFFGPGEPKAMPWGSVYLGEQQLINDVSTIALMDFYRHHQIEFELSFNQPVDHIALFFAVIDRLLGRIIEAESSQKLVSVLSVLLQQHMLPWSGRCFALAQVHAQTEFYLGFACLAEDFQQALAQELNIVSQPVKLFR